MAIGAFKIPWTDRDNGVHVSRAMDMRDLTDRPEDVKRIRIPDGITGFRPGEFSGFTNLEAIWLPESVKSLPAGCFAGCDRLRAVMRHDGGRF